MLAVNALHLKNTKSLLSSRLSCHPVDTGVKCWRRLKGANVFSQALSSNLVTNLHTYIHCIHTYIVTSLFFSVSQSLSHFLCHEHVEWWRSLTCVEAPCHSEVLTSVSLFCVVLFISHGLKFCLPNTLPNGCGALQYNLPSVNSGQTYIVLSDQSLTLFFS